ncbi:MAG: helix-turn-helix domain-containing protein, partial [Chloroflexota bacterium]
MNDPLIKQLSAFGLNQLEAEVYIDLLKNDESTGYAIGKRLGKATANVYKAIEALSLMGAIQISEEGKSKLCQAVPPDLFVDQLQNSFEQRKASLLTSLKSIAVEEESNEKIYRVDSVDLILQKAKMMLENCQRIAVIYAFPTALNLLKSEIKEAIERNVQIIIQAYAPCDISGATVTRPAMRTWCSSTWRTRSPPRPR